MINQHIDLSQLQPVPHKNIVGVLNEYIISSTSLLNNFGNTQVQKINNVSTHLDEIESKLMLLEKKLDSLPQEIFANLQMPEPVNVQNHAPAAPVSQLQPSEPQFGTTPTPPPPPVQQQVQQQPPSGPPNMIDVPDEAARFSPPQFNVQPSQEAPPPMEDSNEPPEEMKKFIKMFNVGVPLVAVKMKMEVEGFDGGMIDKWV